jgi:hypothetical protein
MKVEFINRYQDKIIFEEVSGNIKMTFTEDSGLYIRYGWKTDEHKKNGQYDMIDGSGGPYIAEGTNMGRFHKNWEGKLVDYITPRNPSSKNTYLLVIK